MIGITRAVSAFSGRARAISAAVAVAVAAGAAATGAAPANVPSCDATNGAPFALTTQALKGPTQTDVYAAVTSRPGGCPAPQVLKKVQVKALAADGSTESVTNYFDVEATDGVGIVNRDGLSRHQRLEVTALARTAETVRTVVLKAETTVQLRPELTAKLSGPRRVVRKQPFTYHAAISEINGDTGASAILSLYDGVLQLATAPVSVPANGTSIVAFRSLRLTTVAIHDLLVRITDVSPDEYDAANDKDTDAIGVAMYDVDGAVVSENYQATEIGGEILRAGGNAFDAAAAVQWALNLAEPENTGLGGGVDAVVHLANGEEWAIDGRETAPAAIDATFYGPPRRNFNRNGYSIGVPGTLATMAYMLNHWGTMNLAQTLQPAIDLGKRGVVVSKQLATSINNRGKFDPDTAAIFYPDGHQFVEGDVYFNPDLVKTFELIAAHGPTVFYDGEIADAIVAAQHKSFDAGMGGVMAHDDLSSFSVDVRKPIGIDYRGYRVKTVGPSTAGGIVLLQMLKMVERFPLGTEPDWGFESRNATQVMLEAMRLGFRDQDMWMGDDRPGFYTDMPLKQLISDEYLSQRGSPIRPAARIAPTFAGDPRGYGPIEETPAVEEDASKSREGGDTSHFVIVDRWGNIVSATTTLGDGLGSTITVPGYGFVLNDASGRLFNPTPQAGLKKQVLDGGVLRSIVDPGANDAAPGKRALGNIAPTIVEKDGEPVLVTGGAGGAQIPPAVFQVITNVIDFKKPLEEALDAPRIGGDLTTVFWNCVGDPVPPWFAGAQQFPQITLNALTAIGDTVRRTCEPYPWVGGTESIAIDPDAYSLTAAADPRGLPAVRAPFILAPQ